MSDNDNFDEEHALDLVLNEMIKELSKVRVRFSNQPTYDIIENFRSENFDLINDLYGKYNGEYVMVNKEDYNNSIL
jgi:predicted Zn-dependent protease with MMP-like domain